MCVGVHSYGVSIFDESFIIYSFALVTNREMLCLCRRLLLQFRILLHLLAPPDCDFIWQVGNRREKVAKSSGTLWKLMDGDVGSSDEDDEVGGK